MLELATRAVREGVLRGLARSGHTDAMLRDAGRELAWWKAARVEALRRRRRLVEGHAVAWTQPGAVELVRVEVPLAGPGEVTVLTEASVVSPGTERAYFLRLPNARPSFPYFPGYSLAGTAVAVGRGVGTEIHPGDPVAVIRIRHASVATVRATRVFRVPDGVALDDAAFAYLGVIAGAAVTRAEIAGGEPFAVVGAGPIGLLCQRIASATGAGPATVVARSDRRAAAARAGGAAFVDASEVEESSAAVVFDATGDPAALALAARLAARDGSIVLVGSPRGRAELPIAELESKRLRVIGTHVENLELLSQRSGRDAFGEHARRFLNLIADARLAVSDLAGERVDPREAPWLYRRLAAGDVAAATFDWTVLGPHARLRPARLVRPPRLAARGVAVASRPLREQRLEGPSDPFADAVGMLRVALLGCGDIGVDNAAAVTAAPNATLVACHDPNEELADAVASRFGGDVVGSVDDLLARDDVDAVLLAVPHHLHAPLAVRAADSGRHVVIEKPLARTVAEAREILSAVDRAGVAATVCFPTRFEPPVRRAAELVAAGALGEITGVLVVYVVDKPPSYWVGGFSGRAVSEWRGSRELSGGGVLLMNLSHYIDLVRVVGGLEAEEVAAMMSNAESGEIEDNVSVSVRYANGAVGSFVGSSSARGAAAVQVQLWGSGGHVVLEPDARVYSLRASAGVTARWQSLGVNDVDARAVFVSRFASAVERGDQPDVTLGDALAVQGVIEAAYRAQASGRAEQVS